MVVRKQGDWLAAKVGDELVMMSAEKGNYIGLSEVGARIWELIETPQEVDAVCAQLQNEYDVDARGLPRRGGNLPERTGEAWRRRARSAARCVGSRKSAAAAARWWSRR